MKKLVSRLHISDNLELGLKILDRRFLEVVGTRRVLRKLVLSHKSNWKVIDLVTQSNYVG